MRRIVKAAKRESPSIISVSPSSGITTGGESISIYGLNFVTARNVTFDGTSANFQVISPNKIIATTPAHAAGSGLSINVRTAAGLSENNALFTYVTPGPTVSYLSPNQGTTVTTTSGIFVYGTGFVAPATITFGGTSGTVNIVYGSGTELLVTAPAHAAGAVNVVVTCDGNDSGTTGNGAFTYVAPSGLTPSISSITGADNPIYPTDGTYYTINGSNFDVGCYLLSGGITGISVVINRISSTQLYCFAGGSGDEGIHEVAVRNPGGSLTSSYVYVTTFEYF